MIESRSHRETGSEKSDTDKNMPRNSATVGDLNGWWAWLLKLSLVSFPVFATGIITWATWATSEIMAQKYADHFTVADAVRMQDRWDVRLEKIADKVESSPPAEWKKRIEMLEENQRRMIDQYARISTDLDYIKRAVQKP